MDPLDPKDIQQKLVTFEQNLNEECYTYGWGRGLRCALNLYSDNLNLEEENDILYYKMNKYKNESKKLQEMIDREIIHLMNELTDTIIHNEEQKDIKG